MKRIPLTKGKEAIVDEQDYTFLMQWNWYPTMSGSRRKVYARRNRRMVNYQYERGPCRMHRIVAQRMGLPNGHIDHRNGNGLDNRRANLRPANNSQNLSNRGRQCNNTSGFKGVSRDDERWKWLAQLTVGGRKVLFQRFPRTKVGKVAAARAYNKVALEHFGEFAVLNPV